MLCEEETESLWVNNDLDEFHAAVLNNSTFYL